MNTKQQVTATESCSLTTRRFYFVSICFALLALGPPAFAADTTFIVPSDRVDQAVWGAAANYDSYAQQRPEDLAYIKYVIELYKRYPNAPADRVISRIETARNRFNQTYRRGDPSPPDKPGTGPARYDYFNGACDIIGSVPGGDTFGLGFITSVMRQAREYGDYRYNRQMEPIYRLSSLLKQGARTEAERYDNRLAFDQAFDLAKNNPNAAAVLQSVLGRSANLTAQQIIAANPALAANPTIQTIQSLMNERGEIVASAQQLKTLFGTELQNLQNTMSSNLTLLQDLAANQDVLYRYMVNAEQKRLNQERIAAEQAAYEQKVKAANASVYILSTLAGFNNPELGRQMQVVGDSTVQVADALHQFAKADALGSVILTGNVLGAVMNVVSLFGDSGPSPDAQILAAIAQLQQMVQQLRVEMHERFDRVDAALNDIYSTMNERFNRIDIVLGILRGDVEEIQQTLYNLESGLYRIEGKMFAFLDAGFRRDLNETINGHLGYRETYRVPIPWASYVFAENKFHTWALNNALDELSSGSAGRGYDDAFLYAEIGATTSPPLENNLNYLSQYLVTKGWPAFSTVRLANPRDWAIAANSWMELAGESPMFFRQVSSNRLEQMYRVGHDLQRAMTNITLITTNPTPVANRSLFNILFANYRAKAVVFKQRLREQHQQFLLDLSQDPQRRQRYATLNLWGGPDQPFAPLPFPAITVLQAGSNSHNVVAAIPAPNNWSTIFPGYVPLADFLGLGPIRIEHRDFDLVEQIPSGEVPASESGQLYMGCNSSFSFYVGKFQLAVRGYVGSDAVCERRYTSQNHVASWSDGGHGAIEVWYSVPPSAVYSDGEDCFNGTWSWDYALVTIWGSPADNNGRGGGPTLVDDYLNRAVAVAPGDVQQGTNALRLRIHDALKTLQRGSYNYVLNGLSQAGNLQSAATELSGAKALIDSFIVLGFSQSLEFDDILGSLLFGNERLVETEKAKELCQLGIARTYDTNQNGKVDIATILDERVNGLETWVSNRLTQVQTNGAESLRLVTSTLSRLDAFRAGWSQPTPSPYIAPLGFRLTNGVPNRLFIVWGEPNLRYVVQTSTNLTTWTDLPTPADEGADYITTPSTRSAFYRAVLRP